MDFVTRTENRLPLLSLGHGLKSKLPAEVVSAKKPFVFAHAFSIGAPRLPSAFAKSAVSWMSAIFRMKRTGTLDSRVILASRTRNIGQ